MFVDGCFWHGCPEHYTRPKRNAEFWTEKLKRNMARDKQADQDLRDLGWRVVRVWEHQVTEDLPVVVQLVRRAVRNRRANERIASR